MSPASQERSSTAKSPALNGADAMCPASQELSPTAIGFIAVGDRSQSGCAGQFLASQTAMGYLFKRSILPVPGHR